MIDNEFTKKILAWLESDHKTEDNIMEGAMLLLQINKNRVLFQTVTRRPLKWVGKVVYELEKHVKYRLDGLTHSEMKKMVSDVMPKVENLLQSDIPEGIDVNEGETVKHRHGKRDDHDTLPDTIKAIWDKNCERYVKMKEAFSTAKSLEMDCDRYEYCKFLNEGYQDYKRDMDRYDSYNPEEEHAAATAKDISNARAYISKYRKSLDDAIDSNDTEKAQKQKENIQKRVDILVGAKAEISDDLRQWLEIREFNL